MPKLERDGITLHYEIEGSGQTMVYISGFSDHSNSAFSTTVRQGLSQKYRVINVDNRGAGQTDIGTMTETLIDDMADDVAAVMSAEGIEKAPVLGISMGGMIAMTLALRHPEKVESLVVAVSAVAVDHPSRASFMLETSRMMQDRGIPREIITRYSAVYLLAESIFKIDPFMEAWVNAPEDPLRQTEPGYQVQKSALDHYDIRDKVSAITAPTLVVSSPDDLLVPPRLQDEILDLIPNAEIKRYAGGHIFMGLPMFAGTFYEDVFAFIEKHQ